eukprot:gene11663-biopygen9333
MNVEVCTAVKRDKYIFKYILHQGNDMAHVEIREGQPAVDAQQDIIHDEIRQYLNSRYVGPHQAVYKLVQYEMHDKSHTIFPLAIQLPHQQPLSFTDQQQAAQRNNDSMLMAYFSLNQREDNAHRYFYQDIPEHYTYNKSAKQWQQRKRQSAKEFQEDMPEDYIRHNQLQHPNATFQQQHIHMCLADIQKNLHIHGISLKDFPEMPQLLADYAQPQQPADEINIEQEREQGQRMFEQLNPEQPQIHNPIVQAIETQSPDNCFYLDGPAGTGKTFLYNTLVHNQLPDTKSTRALKAVERLLRDITKAEQPFGGKYFMLGSDFRKVMPVVKNADRERVVQECL